MLGETAKAATKARQIGHLDGDLRGVDSGLFGLPLLSAAPAWLWQMSSGGISSGLIAAASTKRSVALNMKTSCRASNTACISTAATTTQLIQIRLRMFAEG